MLASKTCSGSVSSACATHDTFQMEYWASPAAFALLLNEPGCAASGQVRTIVRMANAPKTRTNSVHAARPRKSEGVGSFRVVHDPVEPDLVVSVNALQI